MADQAEDSQPDPDILDSPKPRGLDLTVGIFEKNEMEMSDISGQDDVERISGKEEENPNLSVMKQMEQAAIIESENLQKVINEAKTKLENQKKIINQWQTKTLEAKGQTIPKRDYMFGLVQKLLRLILPATYAIYGTIIINLLLSSTNAASDLSVFWWLLGQQQTNTAYIILGRTKTLHIHYPDLTYYFSGVDYLPGILTITHHLTESLNNQVGK